MVDMQSKEVIDKVSDELKIQPAMAIPKALAEKLQLVYQVNPDRLIKWDAGTVSDATSGTLFTTSTTKDTFVVGCMISVAKSALSPSIITRLNGTTFEGIATEFFIIRYEPSTAGQFTQSIAYTHPIKLQRGTAVTLTNSSATASIDAGAVVYFYETDPQ